MCCQRQTPPPTLAGSIAGYIGITGTLFDCMRVPIISHLNNPGSRYSSSALLAAFAPGVPTSMDRSAGDGDVADRGVTVGFKK